MKIKCAKGICNNEVTLSDYKDELMGFKIPPDWVSLRCNDRTLYVCPICSNGNVWIRSLYED